MKGISTVGKLGNEEAQIEMFQSWLPAVQTRKLTTRKTFYCMNSTVVLEYTLYTLHQFNGLPDWCWLHFIFSFHWNMKHAMYFIILADIDISSTQSSLKMNTQFHLSANLMFYQTFVYRKCFHHSILYDKLILQEMFSPLHLYDKLIFITSTI